MAAIVAKESNLAKSVNLHTDHFYHCLCKGTMLPYLSETDEQNLVVIKTLKCFARDGSGNSYDVIEVHYN